MLDKVKQTYDHVEGLKGKRLLTIVVVVFILFIFIGIAVGYFTNFILNRNEPRPPDNSTNIVDTKDSYEGKIVYIDPSVYPQEDITYTLVDGNNKEIILLKANDAKLSIVEGLNVKVAGKKSKTKDGTKDVLIVSEVILSK